jgi:F0F1-type ATP synthase epsilon subunit
MSKLHLEIVSPNETIYNNYCYMAVLPLISGCSGIMQNHSSFVSILQPGEIIIYDSQNNIIQTILVQSGFAQIENGQHLLVLMN